MVQQWLVFYGLLFDNANMGWDLRFFIHGGDCEMGHRQAANGVQGSERCTLSIQVSCRSESNDMNSLPSYFVFEMVAFSS